MDAEGEGRRCVASADELAAAGRYEEAIAWYEQAILRAPVACAGYRFVGGELLFELQRYDDAARTFEAVIGALPEHAPGWEALGRTLSMLGRAEHAAAALERAIALDARFADAARDDGLA